MSQYRYAKVKTYAVYTQSNDPVHKRYIVRRLKRFTMRARVKALTRFQQLRPMLSLPFTWGSVKPTWVRIVSM